MTVGDITNENEDALPCERPFVNGLGQCAHILSQSATATQYDTKLLYCQCLPNPSSYQPFGLAAILGIESDLFLEIPFI